MSNPSEDIPRTSADAAEKMDAPLRNQEGEEIGPYAGDNVPSGDAIQRHVTGAAARPHAAAREALHRRVDSDFTYHPPQDPDVTVAYTRIRGRARQFAHELIEAVPPSRELSTALTKLEEAVMHANAGIARSGGK